MKCPDVTWLADRSKRHRLVCARASAPRHVQRAFDVAGDVPQRISMRRIIYGKVALSSERIFLKNSKTRRQKPGKIRIEFVRLLTLPLLVLLIKFYILIYAKIEFSQRGVCILNFLSQVILLLNFCFYYN